MKKTKWDRRWAIAPMDVVELMAAGSKSKVSLFSPRRLLAQIRHRKGHCPKRQQSFACFLPFCFSCSSTIYSSIILYYVACALPLVGVMLCWPVSRVQWILIQWIVNKRKSHRRVEELKVNSKQVNGTCGKTVISWVAFNEKGIHPVKSRTEKSSQQRDCNLTQSMLWHRGEWMEREMPSVAVAADHENRSPLFRRKWTNAPPWMLKRQFLSLDYCYRDEEKILPLDTIIDFAGALVCDDLARLINGTYWIWRRVGFVGLWKIANQ